MTRSPLEIVDTLLPVLFRCARYANAIQGRIEALEDKAGAENIFTAALSDADLTIQSAVELSVIADLPEVPFFGEEWKSSPNTKYLAGTHFIPDREFLITLNPIDGTRLYLDGHPLYQIVLTVISRTRFEAALVLYPALGDYVFAQRGQGARRGIIGQPLSSAEPWRLNPESQGVYSAPDFQDFFPQLKQAFGSVHCSTDYRRDAPMPYLSSAVRGSLRGAITYAAQVIDSAALAFVAQEMGYQVCSYSGAPLPSPADYPELVLPGVIVADTVEAFETLKSIAREHHLRQAKALS